MFLFTETVYKVYVNCHSGLFRTQEVLLAPDAAYLMLPHLGYVPACALPTPQMNPALTSSPTSSSAPPFSNSESQRRNRRNKLADRGGSPPLFCCPRQPSNLQLNPIHVYTEVPPLHCFLHPTLPVRRGNLTLKI